MKVSIPTDDDFRIDECKDLFLKSNKTLEENSDFYNLINSFQIFQYSKDDDVIGYIYYFYEDGKLFVASFANRGFAEYKNQCLQESLAYYDCDVYAKTKQRHVAICLLKNGFKKISNNLYKYER